MKQTFEEFKPLFLALLTVVIAVFLFAHPAAKNSVVIKPAEIPTVRVPILMYHHVGFLANTDQGIKYDQIAEDLTVSPADFEAQVIYLKDGGYQTVSLHQVYNALVKDEKLPPKSIVFTFDDGYKDVFVNAIPILQKYGLSGTFAIATELLGRPSYAVWDDVIAAKNDGMEIVSHTENHLDLTNSIYSQDDLHREIFGSKQILEQKLATPIDFFVYPYGHHNPRVEQMVKDAGYKMAFGTAYGLDVSENNLFAEPRVRVHGQDGLEKLKRILERSARTVPSQPNL